MRNKTFTEFLKCIRCNTSKLTFINEGNELLCENCSQKYVVTDNVPVFLPEDKQTLETKAEIHQKLNTSFNYIDHYEKDAYASDYFAERDKGTEHSDKRVRETIATQISGKKGIILDVGCGKAWVAESFCPQGYEVISMDISLLNTSKALKLHPFEKHHAVVADAFSLPFKENSFDYIIASEIIEHVYNPATFVKNLFQVLKPGGKLIVTTPYKEKIQYSLCIHCNNPTPIHAHLHSFDENSLKLLYSGKDLNSISYQTFINKILIHLRLHVLLKHLNYKIWKLCDRAVNLFYNAPLRIMVIWEKKKS